MIVASRSLFFKNKFILINFIISIFLNFVLFFLIFLKIRPSSEPIALHYNIYLGIDLIGNWYKIYFLPLLGLIILLVNTLLAYYILKKERILAYFLVSASTFAQIILLVAGAIVVLLNI